MIEKFEAMVIEANRDAARDCVIKAKEAMLSNNMAKVKRLLQKAKALDPDCDVERIFCSTLTTVIDVNVKIFSKMDIQTTIQIRDQRIAEDILTIMMTQNRRTVWSKKLKLNFNILFLDSSRPA